jgi:hypothetical protein
MIYTGDFVVLRSSFRQVPGRRAENNATAVSLPIPPSSSVSDQVTMHYFVISC